MATMKLGSKTDSFQLEDQTWICMTDLASDVTVKVGEMSFQLHKFPLINRSGTLQEEVNKSQDDESGTCEVNLSDIPGGFKTFELVARFFYDIKIELNAQNIVALRCAGEFLKMTDDFGEGNLITQTENFLTEVLSNWNDSIRALQTCADDVLEHAEKLHIVSRCIDSLATKACAEPGTFGWPLLHESYSMEGSMLWNGIADEKTESLRRDWWYRDVSYLKFQMYKELIKALKSKGMKPAEVAGSLKHYSRRYLQGLTRRMSQPDPSASTSAWTVSSETDQRRLLEEIVDLLPSEKGAAPTQFLLSLLRTAVVLNANPACKENLEKRIGNQLDDAQVEDLKIPNVTSSKTLYDVDCIQRILDHFIFAYQSSFAASPDIVEEGQTVPAAVEVLTPITMVGRLIDGYLAEVSADENLKCTQFQAIAALVPDYARPLDDGIYRAIDIYLKAHPKMTDSEREQLCRLLNCQKLSLEACTHAAQNERLPLRVIVQVLFFEQLRLRTTIAGWFFVSDNVDRNGSRLLPRSTNGEATGEENGGAKLTVDEIKLRVSELERECDGMRQQITKIGKSKSGSGPFGSICRRLGFGSTKPIQQAQADQKTADTGC
ncbi:BTB/POZ domain-containing protein family [Rhynchospora pubera]|uniref:BTB/POZ domain-containing protein family n=1 Tax=Rhynchospora pubera TaxID=906938 RepID=A0AAV8C0G9_9POAL|nr:BTB/POZ domain-containing protein family [Rhynchospora pubera]